MRSAVLYGKDKAYTVHFNSYLCILIFFSPKWTFSPPPCIDFEPWVWHSKVLHVPIMFFFFFASEEQLKRVEEWGDCSRLKLSLISSPHMDSFRFRKINRMLSKNFLCEQFFKQMSIKSRQAQEKKCHSSVLRFSTSLLHSQCFHLLWAFYWSIKVIDWLGSTWKF